MDIKILKQYIKANSTQNSRNNAYNIQPDLIHNTHNSFQFEYWGGGSEPYNIKIDFIDNAVHSSCSCPYKNSYSGICKHTVAAIEQIVEGINDGSILLLDFETSTPKKASQKLAYNQLILPKGMITNEIENKLNPKTYRRYYSESKIVAASQTEVTTKATGWDRCTQVFTFKPETSVLEFECDCSKAKKLCEHIGQALEEITTVLGNDFFTPNYLENKIEAFLKTVGFTPQDNYQDIFSFSITPKGVKTTSKYKNIVNNAEDFSAIFEDESAEQATFLPTMTHHEKEFGLAICFEFNKKKFIDTKPLVGKYNKAKTDFASSFSFIDFHEMKDQLIYFDEPEDQDVIFKTLQISHLLKVHESTSSINHVKKAVSYLKDLLPLYANKTIYKYDNYESLIKKNLVQLTIEEKKVRLFFSLQESEHFFTLKAKIAIDDKNYNLNAVALTITPLFIIQDTTAIPITDVNLFLYIQNYKEFPEINYLKKEVPDFFEKVILPLSKKFEIQSTVFKKIKTKTIDDGLEKQVYISDANGTFITFKLAVQYPKQLVDVFSNELLFEVEDATQNVTYKERNQAFEDNFIEEFKQLHPNFEEQENFFYLNPEALFENYWMLHATDRMKQMGITVFGANELKSFKFNINKPVINVSLKSDIDWFDIEIDISFGNQKASMKELQKAFLKKSNYVTLGDGSLGILPEEWMKKFASYFKTGEIKKNGIQISNYQFGIIDELYQEIDTKPTFLEELYNKKKRLQNIAEIEAVPIPKGIKAKLRDYQHHGLNWLAFLDKNQLGGCLADDMGLGKTLQTITFLQYLKVQNPKNAPSLIIAPTSLIFNWNNEIEKFCPTLKMLTFTGASRLDNKDNFNKYDLIISTYGSLLNDIEFLKDFKFHYVILDESQAIKNPNSKRYKAVRLLNSYNKIALTGTPIENNTYDLYAQLNFLNPGLLGNMSHFKTNFSDAIDKEKDFDASQILGKIITPFMLRRTKEQVATELPEKTESIIFCEMGKEQRGVYDTFKNKYRDYLLNKIDENGVEKSQMYILEGLTKLRQICNSTALIPTEEDFGNYSIKLETLIENIKEKTGKHKILVFSQFVKMLQIVKNRLEEDQIHYEYLDGQTTNRQEKVENFQNNANVRVFLISLKAGGTGLNLTEADYVFIIDPWWNPAVENQAIDRCYRIGQTKKVMAYRMICKDTIEEKIVSLQQKKKNVASSIISIDQDEKKSFDINEVKELFK